jgi:hypothetical protein
MLPIFRLATVEMSGRVYEAGGSVIHPRNEEVKALVKELGEMKKKEDKYCRGFVLKTERNRATFMH